MSLFKTILSKILPGHNEPVSPAQKSPPLSPPSADATTNTTRASTHGSSSGAAVGAASAGSSSKQPPHAAPSLQSAASNPASPPNPVDVATVLDGLAAGNREQLDWKRSIVDLMKLLDMDSSPAARRELAAELGYPGDTGNSAEMNVWLHQQVLRKLAGNGGKVPAELLV